MKRVLGVLFYDFAVFLTFIELSSQVSLRELFPECEGDDLPAIKTIIYKADPNLIKLRRLVKGDVMECYESTTSLAIRTHIVVGWMEGTTIRAITSESRQLDVVFDTNANDFVPLNHADLTRLGVNRRLHTIRKKEEAAEMRRERQQANFQAIQQRNHLAAHQAYAQLNHPAIHQAYNQLNHLTVYEASQQEYLGASLDQTSYQANPLAFHSPIPQAHGQFNHPAIHHEYYDVMQHTNLQASQEVNRQVNHLTSQANPQSSMRENIQTPRMDPRFTKKQRNN